eukprot:jgi/Mesvir1/4887/Mv26579-RA.1
MGLVRRLGGRAPRLLGISRTSVLRPSTIATGSFASSNCAAPAASRVLDILRPFSSEVAFRRPAGAGASPAYYRPAASLRDKDPFSLPPTAALKALRELANLRQAKPRDAAMHGSGRWTPGAAAAVIGKLASQRKLQDAMAAFHLARSLGLCDGGVCAAMLKGYASSGLFATALSLGVLAEAQGAGWQPSSRGLGDLIIACGRARDMAGVDALLQCAPALLAANKGEDAASWQAYLRESECRAAGLAGDVARVRESMQGVEAQGCPVPLHMYTSLAYALGNVRPQAGGAVPASAGAAPGTHGGSRSAPTRRVDAVFGVVDEARRAGMAPDTALMNACLWACTWDGEGGRAMATLADMEAGGMGAAAAPNAESYLAAVRACSPRQLDDAFALVGRLTPQGAADASSDKQGAGAASPGAASSVAGGSAPRPSLTLYNALIQAAGAAGQPQRAREAMDAARAAGFVPNTSSYNALLAGYLRRHDLAGYRVARDEMATVGVAPNTRTEQLDTRMAAEAGNVRAVSSALLAAKSRRVLLRLADYNQLLWTCSQGPNWPNLPRVLGIKSQMQLQGVTPDLTSYNLMLKCCSAPGRAIPSKRPGGVDPEDEDDAKGMAYRMEVAEVLVAEMRAQGVALTALTLERLLYAYAQAGDKDRAGALLVRVRGGEFAPGVTAVSGRMYEAAVRCCQRSGDVARAEALLEEMRSDGLQPRVGVYASIIRTYGYAEPPDLDRMFAFLDASRAQAGVTDASGQLVPPVFSAAALACTTAGAPARAWSLLDALLARQGPLDELSASSAMAVYASAGDAEGARALLGRVKSELGGPPPSLPTHSAGKLVSLYLLAVQACGVVGDAAGARALRDECEQLGLLRKEATGWADTCSARLQMARALVSAVATAGDTQGALDLIYASRQQGDIMDAKTFRAVLASTKSDTQRQEVTLLMKMDGSQDPLQLDEAAAPHPDLAAA